MAARISLPSTAARGELIEVKTLIAHPMETGFRRNSVGARIPRDILTRFECLYDGRLVFSADLHPAVAANPFISFYLTADRSGALEFRWTDQHGEATTASRSLTVRET